MTLSPIPWQPTLYLRAEALALLTAASARVGRNLLLYNGLSAWRSYEQQDALWRAAQNGGNVASRPDRGPRPHMRGGAFDLADTSAKVQAACREVGLIREPSEPWHWQHPNTLSWPIISSSTPAGGGSTPIPADKRKKDTMHLAHILNYDGKGTTLWLQYDALFYLEFTGDEAATAIASQIGGWSAGVSRSFFDKVKAEVEKNRAAHA